MDQPNPHPGPAVGTGLLRLRGEAPERVRAILSRAAAIMDGASPAAGEMAGRSVALLFEENSTRTRGSFTVAAHRLGLGVVDLSSGTSLSKGESIADTVRTIAAMGVDAIVIRSSRCGAARVASEAVGIPVINAGDGKHEHPTQGLLDALAFSRAAGNEKARADRFDFNGVTLAVVGDVVSSRVARSDIACFTMLGAEVVVVGPPALAPRSLESLGVRVERDLDAVLGSADAVQMLRVQFERHGGRGVPSKRAYRAGYALTVERAQRMKPGAVVMHPGPMNRGLEIDDCVADSWVVGGGNGPANVTEDAGCGAGMMLPRSIVLDQVTCGVAVRTAAFESLLTPGTPGRRAGVRA